MRKPSEMFALILAVGFALPAALNAASPESYLVLELERAGLRQLDVFTQDELKNLNQYLNEEQALVTQAMKGAYADWMQNAETKTIPFPMRGNPWQTQIRQQGTFSELQHAREKLESIEERIELQRPQRNAALLQSAIAQASNATARKQMLLEGRAREMLEARLETLRKEKQLGPPPLEGLIRGKSYNSLREREIIDLAATRALAFLAASGSSGSWSGGNMSPRITAAVAGLAMLGAAPGGGPLAPIVHKIKTQLVASRATKDGEPVDRVFASWLLGFRGVFLAEYYAHYPAPDVRAALEENAKLLFKIANEDGCWHHGYGDQAKYEVHASGIQCLASLGLAQSYGIDLDKSALDKSLTNMVSEKGHVGYSRKNGHFAPGRSLGMAWAYTCCGDGRSPRANGMRSAGFPKMTEVKHDHASPALHQFWRALYCHVQGQSDWNEYWGLFKDRLLALQQGDGSFIQAPWADADMDKLAGPNYCTAMYAFVLVLPRRNLQGIFNISALQAKFAGRDGAKSWIGAKFKEHPKGLEVTESINAGPASLWGIKLGTVVVSIDRKPLAKVSELKDLLAGVPPGNELNIVFLPPKAMDEKTETLKMVAQPRPAKDISTVWD